MDNRYLCRGKRVDNGEWVVGCYVESEWLNTVYGTNGYDHIIIEIAADGEQYEIDPATLGRCTGLLAAKSYRGDGEMERLIFEGDVVRRKADVYKLGERAPVGTRIVVGTVIWDDHWKKEAGSWAVSAHDEHGNPTNYSLMSDFEIISTIHDNYPEQGGEKGTE